jgi:hypothetical protein
MPVLAGIVTVSVDGDPLRVKATCKFNFGGKERTPQDGNRFYGFTDAVRAGRVEVGVLLHADTDIATLQSLEAATVTLEFDNGKAYVMTEASTMDPIEGDVGAGENEVTIVLGGNPIRPL